MGKLREADTPLRHQSHASGPRGSGAGGGGGGGTLPPAAQEKQLWSDVGGQDEPTRG